MVQPKVQNRLNNRGFIDMGNSRQVVALRITSAWRRGRSVVDVISIRNACEILYGYMLIMKLTDYFVDDY
ncbi:hypothetical protein D3C85_1557100 [compost metagenome]